MDKILDINLQDLDCIVEPGVGWMSLAKELKKHGLQFPPDPGAASACGGLCSTNASGTLAGRYGGTWMNVRYLRVVLANGKVINTRSRAPKSSAGYNLTNLFIGSEGTLGIITKICVKLVHLPKLSGAGILQFNSLQDAAHAAHKIVLAGIPLQRLELMDSYAVKSVNLAYDETLPERDLLLLDYAGDTLAEIEQQQNSIAKMFADLKVVHHSVTMDPIKADQMWSIRKRAFFASKSLSFQQVDDLQKTILTTDVAVPISKLADILVYTQELRRELSLTATLVAHAGDGNFHALVVFPHPSHAEYKTLVERAEKFRSKMAKRAIQLGGTCTGEHGIGVGKRELLVEELGVDAVQVMRDIKRALDPNAIFNPGKVFDLSPHSKL
jgi:D-lactate dehydrogenase (cytochrome)